MIKKKLLYIQIPCLNEAETIGEVIQEIPRRKLESLGLKVKILVIDDNSSDKTFQIAKEAGANFVLKNKLTVGLGKSFKIGLSYCLSQGADIIVNTDGDNQYDQREIVKIVRPILTSGVDMVIGDRQIEKITFMPTSKKIGNQIGSLTIRLLTGLSIRDASSGFRAFSREIAEKFNLHADHTYTHETIIQASYLGAIILDMPVSFRKRISGESRLIEGIYEHIKKSGAIIVRTVFTYKAFKFLLTIGLVIILMGGFGVLRFLFFFFLGDGRGHIQSLIISSVLINLGFVTIALGVIADLISVNRKMLEEIKLSSLKSHT